MELSQEQKTSLKEQLFGNGQSNTVMPTLEQPIVETPSLAEVTPTIAQENLEVIEEPVIENPLQSLLKEQFGYDSPDVLKAELEEYKKLKEAPPTKQELEFKDELSKKYYSYIKDGKEEELYENLKQRVLVKNLDGMNDEAKLKLYIQMQNPKFDKDMVDYEFKNNYSLDETKFTDEFDEVDEFKKRMETAKLEQKLERELEQANQFFNQYKEKLQLPDIEKKQEVDADYEDYKQLRLQSETEAKLLAERIESVSQADLVFKTKFDDKDNKGLAFEATISLDKEDFEQAKKDASNVYGYLQDNYTAKDGSVDVVKLMLDLSFAKNKEKYAQSYIKQGTTNALIWHLKNQKAGADQQRNYSAVQLSDVEQFKSQVFGK